MADSLWERIDPLIARWKKFEPSADAERLAALEHSPTSELQRLVREVDEAKTDIDAFIEALEKKYGVSETGDIGAETAPEPTDDHRYQALRALKRAYDEAAEEIADRELEGEG
ncbi:MAG TPA: hypothetical protein VEJ20_02925 [Candidatus Eremiobacteraceae bacterium]|nr:hypothetical protein [Candidatus Eremiobacteraceae bacterium]